MPGAMSDSDRSFLVSMVPRLTTTPEGQKLIIEARIAQERRSVEVAKLAREYRQKNKTMDGFSQSLAAWSDANPLYGDAFLARAQQVGGASAGGAMPPKAGAIKFLGFE
jgi:hypothetical protein